MQTKTEDLVAMARLRDWCRSGTAKAIRVGADVTLDEVSAACDVSPSAVSLWERGKRTARGENALAYLRVLEGLMGR